MNNINDKMFTTQTNKTSEYHRQFMLSEWKDIISMNIKKFSKNYPELKNMDIDECSKQIEEIIYNKCVYKNNSNLSFYFFCQVYIYIYLTDIFKDIFIEKFIIHIYNCYVNNDIKDIVHCHDYILKNIVYYDCSIESELIKYINLINKNVKKLSEIMFNKYKNSLKKYSSTKVSSQKGIFDNIFDSVKEIFTGKKESEKKINTYSSQQSSGNLFRQSSDILSQQKNLEKERINLIKQKEEINNEYKKFSLKQQKELDDIKKAIQSIPRENLQSEKFLQNKYNDLQNKYNDIIEKNNKLKNKENELLNREKLITEKINELNLKEKEKEIENKSNQLSSSNIVKKKCECIDNNYLINFENRLKNELSKINDEKCIKKVDTAFEEIKKIILLNNNTNTLSEKWSIFNNEFSNIIKKYNDEIKEIKKLQNDMKNKGELSSIKTYSNFDIIQMEKYIQNKYMSIINNFLQEYFQYFDKNFNNILKQNTNNTDLLKKDIVNLINNFDIKFNNINNKLQEILLKYSSISNLVPQTQLILPQLPQNVSVDSLEKYKLEINNIIVSKLNSFNNTLNSVKGDLGKLSNEYINNNKTHNDIINNLSSISKQLNTLQTQYSNIPSVYNANLDNESKNNIKNILEKISEIRKEHQQHKSDNDKFNNLLRQKLDEIKTQSVSFIQPSSDSKPVAISSDISYIINNIKPLLNDQSKNIEMFQKSLSEYIKQNDEKFTKIITKQNDHDGKLDTIIKIVNDLNQKSLTNCKESHDILQEHIKKLENQINILNGKLDTQIQKID